MVIPNEIGKKIAVPPATPIFVGKKKVDKTVVRAITCNAKNVEVLEVELEKLPIYSKGILWLDIVGLHGVEVVKKVGEAYSIHPLVIEDVLNTSQRVKLEDYEDYIFVVIKVFTFDNGLEVDQLSLILKENVLITFRERDYDFIDAVLKRVIAGGRGSADYLMYTILDAVVDSYFKILLEFSESIDKLEDEIFSRFTMETSGKLHKLKRELNRFKMAIYPVREILSFLARYDHKLVSADNRIYFRDVHDHAIRVIETSEYLRDLAMSLRELYLSNLSNRLNEIMKLLTIISTIFIPITFITGIYGMNFRYMPELEWKYGYYAILTVMSVISLMMLIYFKKKGWV